MEQEKDKTTTQAGLDHIAQNLSRVTTHDARLISGVNENIVQGGVTDPSLNQAFVSGPQFTGETFTNQEFSDQRFPGQFSTTQYGTVATNLPITQENAFIGREFGDPMGASGLQTTLQPHKETQFTGLQQNTMPQSNLATEVPFQTGHTGPIGETMTEEEHKKKGFFSKVSGIFKHDKSDKTLEGSHNIEKIHEPPGILDEKGTTVSMAQGLASTSQLGLPVLGPDYTHGTHGTTTHTVFTGGYGTEGFGSLGPMGDSRTIGPGTGMATTSLPVTLNPGVEQGITSTGTGLVGRPGLQGVDVSGANATHIERDITLQEGGLLGLRQGAVTGNPGDIITNYDESAEISYPSSKIMTQPIPMTNVQPLEPVQMTTSTFTTVEQPIKSEIINVRQVPPTGLGHDCTLIKHKSGEL